VPCNGIINKFTAVFLEQFTAVLPHFLYQFTAVFAITFSEDTTVIKRGQANHGTWSNTTGYFRIEASVGLRLSGN
jgi:hypothetical protein